MLTLTTDKLPKPLAAIGDPPKSLYVLGTDVRELINQPIIAVVGSRRVSPYGRQVTEKLITSLAEAGVIIVSGLALGVDSIAHSAALKAGGQTIAVLPGGIKRVYPRSHEPLARQILLSGGALISERGGTESPREFDFLIRNRLISGLSEAVLITEAAERSGSLNTARHALEQGRTVFAVPGNITSDLSVGTNNLIKAGATPVTSVVDIYQAMGWRVTVEPTMPKAMNESERVVLELISQGVSGAEELLVRSRLHKSAFIETMTMLEISGVIKPLGANQWSL